MSENSIEEAPDYERQLWEQLVRDFAKGNFTAPTMTQRKEWNPTRVTQWQAVGEPTQWQQVQ